MDSNRVSIALVREATLGVMPASPLMRTAYMTSEALAIAPSFFTPAGIRADRMSFDPQLMQLALGGPVDTELSFFPDGSFWSEVWRSAFWQPWQRGAAWDNSDPSFGSITSVATAALNVADGSALANGFAASAVVLGHIIRTTGFGITANNGIFRPSAAGSGTSIAFPAATFTAEASPPSTARAKVVGFQGVSGDIVATTTGLQATTLNFTTLGLSPGQWLKIGDASFPAGNFATAANNGWARISGPITATFIPLDNLPAGWGADTGTGQTIRVFFGDFLRNGTTRTSVSKEKRFLSQATPTLIQYRGQVVDQLSLTYQTDQAVSVRATFVGTDYAAGTTAISGATYQAVPNVEVMSCNANVGRIAENGSPITTANWVRRLQLDLANNVRRINAIGKIGSYDLGVGEVGVTGTIETYFSNITLLQRMLGSTVTNLNARTQLNNRAMILGLPRVTLTSGDPQASGKNQDVTLPLNFVASFDSVTNAEICWDRFEYFN